jgi:hypothetical protein
MTKKLVAVFGPEPSARLEVSRQLHANIQGSGLVRCEDEYSYDSYMYDQPTLMEGSCRAAGALLCHNAVDVVLMDGSHLDRNIADYTTFSRGFYDTSGLYASYLGWEARDMGSKPDRLALHVTSRGADMGDRLTSLHYAALDLGHDPAATPDLVTQFDNLEAFYRHEHDPVINVEIGNDGQLDVLARIISDFPFTYRP